MEKFFSPLQIKNLQTERQKTADELTENGASVEFVDTKNGALIPEDKKLPARRIGEQLVVTEEQIEDAHGSMANELSVEAEKKLEQDMSIKQKTLEWLKKSQILSEHDGKMVVDINALTNLTHTIQDGKEKTTYLYQITLTGKHINLTRQIIYDALKDISAVEKSEYAQDQNAEPSPIFNVPQSEQGAFDAEVQKNNHYHLNHWEFISIGADKPAIIEAKNGEKIDARAFSDFVIKQRPDKNPIKRKLLEFMFENNIFEQSGKLIIFDKNKFDTIINSDKRVLNNITESFYGKTYRATKDSLYHLLGDIEVVPIETLQKAHINQTEPKPIPLFNVPESLAEAINPESITNKEYCLNFWDAYNKNMQEWNQTLLAKNGDSVSLVEFGFATKLFRDLKARRDEANQLLIFDQKQDKYIPCSTDNLRKVGLSMRFTDEKEKNYNLNGSPHSFLIKGCPHLLENPNSDKKSPLNLYDFQVNSGSESGQLLRQRNTTHAKNPIVGFGVRYYIGRDNFYYPVKDSNGQIQEKKLSLKNCEVVELDNELIGIVETITINKTKKKQLRCVIDRLTDKETVDLRESTINKMEQKGLSVGASNVTANMIIGAPEVRQRTHAWNPSEASLPAFGEQPETYLNRVSGIDDFALLDDISMQFTIKCGVGIHNLPWKHQLWLCRAALEMHDEFDQIIDFAKNYGLEGLKTFLAVEFGGNDLGKKILALGNELKGTPDAQNLFNTYGSLTDEAKHNAKQIVELYHASTSAQGINTSQVEVNILQRATELLSDTSSQITGRKLSEIEKHHIIKSLVTELQHETEIQQQHLTEFKEILKNLNGRQNSDNQTIAPLEAKLNQIVFGNFDAKTEELLKSRYEEIKLIAYDLADYLKQNFADQQHHLSQDEIVESLLKEAYGIIATPSASKAEQSEAMAKLDRCQANIIAMDKVLRRLPREEVANLDLRNIPVVERLENISAEALLQNQELVGQLTQIIDKQFPAGDAEAFVNELTQKKNLKITIALVDSKILSFFTSEQKSEHFRYLDWFISNPDVGVKGLGEATAKLAFDEETDQADSNQAYYTVAKPHVKSFALLIEKFGFVGFGGSTDDGEYKHHYARTRRLPNDRRFASKTINADNPLFRQTISHLTTESNEINEWHHAGKILRVAKVEFHGQNHHDDITENQPDGWLLKEIKHQYQSGYVLTRYIPESDDKNNQTYFVVFEKDQPDQNLQNELWSIITPQDDNSDHSASKKALNS
ncbi:MAG: hypothetical protein WCK11_03740 [Candidatus Falkowbacteria bacterium]